MRNRKKIYSGKKKIHTIKNQLIVLPSGTEIVDELARRIVIEHMIRLIKIFRVAQERFRLRIQNYERIILTVCGLVRLKAGALILEK
jgi:hypothetical protein